MDREQKIRFIKEIIAASDKLKNSDEEGFQKLSDNIEKGMFSKFNIEGAGDFSSEDLDEVLKESPWVVDMVFEMIKGFNSEEKIDFGHERPFKMSDLHGGISDLMEKFKIHEEDQKL